MLYLEDQYTLTSEKKIQKAISIVADCNKYHPIRDYLNGLSKRKYLTFGVESENYRTAKPRLERIETDLLNHFKRLGAAAAFSAPC